MNKGAPLGKTS